MFCGECYMGMRVSFDCLTIMVDAVFGRSIAGKVLWCDLYWYGQERTFEQCNRDLVINFLWYFFAM